MTLASVDFGQKKLVFVDFGRKNWNLTEKNWFWSILAGKSGFGQFRLEKLDFDRNNGFWLMSTEKNWFWSILAEKGGHGRFWVILGFPEFSGFWI